MAHCQVSVSAQLDSVTLTLDYVSVVIMSRFKNIHEARQHIQDHPYSPKRFLDVFWSQFDRCRECRGLMGKRCLGKCKKYHFKLKLLKIAVEYRTENKKAKQKTIMTKDRLKNRRNAFNTSFSTQIMFDKKRFPCFVCGGKHHHRHHIVPLKNGGSNHYRNVIPVCKDCHKLVHNWM